jgi:hypothetical protein
VWGGFSALYHYGGVKMAIDVQSLAIVVLVWEFLLVCISYWLLLKKIKVVRKEFEKAAIETVKTEEAKAATLITAAEARIRALEAWREQEEALDKEDDEIRRQELAERGAIGIQSRRDKSELQRLAYEEGANILRSPGTIDEKKARLFGLLSQYPQIAVSVGQRLNRAFHISDALGISEVELIQLAAREAAKLANSGASQAAPPGYG